MTPPQTKGVDHAAFVAGFRKLAAAFPASFADERAAEDKMRLWRELVTEHQWISAQVFAAGVREIAWRHEGDYLPGPATALDYFEEAGRALERAAREQRAKLPAPPPPTDRERLEADTRAAAAKGAARARLPARMRKPSPLRGETPR